LTHGPGRDVLGAEVTDQNKILNVILTTVTSIFVFEALDW